MPEGLSGCSLLEAPTNRRNVILFFTSTCLAPRLFELVSLEHTSLFPPVLVFDRVVCGDSGLFYLVNVC